MSQLSLLFLIGLSMRSISAATNPGQITCPTLNCNPKLDASTCFSINVLNGQVQTI